MDFELRYLTRGNVSPNGKRKVFFLATRKDSDLYFKSLTEEIFSYINAAIYYVDDIDLLDLNDKEILINLSTMDLFLTPITSALFESENIKKIVDFIKQNNLLTLPIIKEQGLIKKFRNLFGDIQFLDPIQKSKTEIPYETKLKNFLDNLLVTDELVEQIKKSFDAYIFLSYRKKDRESALKLMNLIHENEFLRSIAIWYDEYLIPGKHFEDAILKALVESDLFALVVTPNILEKENYVKDVEYKLALKYNKNLLPFKLQETDTNSLKEMYENLPEVEEIDTKNIESSIFKKIGSLISKKHNSKEHNFFIGLAYLHGIDVEKNINLAVDLLTMASNDNLKEAHLELANIYKNALGLNKDLERAYFYYQKYLNCLKEDFIHENSEEKLIIYLDALNETIDYQKYLKKSFIKNFKLEVNSINELTSEFKTLTKKYYADAKIKNLKLIKSKRSYLRSYKVYDEVLNTYKDLYLNEFDKTKKANLKINELLIVSDYADYLFETNREFNAHNLLEDYIKLLIEDFNDIAENTSRFDLVYSLIYSKFGYSLNKKRFKYYAKEYLKIALPKARKYAYETNNLEGKSSYLKTIIIYLDIYSEFGNDDEYLLPVGFLIEDIKKLIKKENYIYLYKELSKAIYLDGLINLRLNSEINDKSINNLLDLYSKTKNYLNELDSLIICVYYSLLKYKIAIAYNLEFIDDELTLNTSKNNSKLLNTKLDKELVYKYEVIKLTYKLENKDFNESNFKYVYKTVDELVNAYYSYTSNNNEFEDDLFYLLTRTIHYYLEYSNYSLANYFLIILINLTKHNEERFISNIMKVNYFKDLNKYKTYKDLFSKNELVDIYDNYAYHHLFEYECILNKLKYALLNIIDLENYNLTNHYYDLSKLYINTYFKTKINKNASYYNFLLNIYKPLLFSKVVYQNEDLITSKLYRNIKVIINSFIKVIKESTSKNFKYLYEFIANINLITLLEYSYYFNSNKDYNYKDLISNLDILDNLNYLDKHINLTHKIKLELAKKELLKANIIFNHERNINSYKESLLKVIGELKTIDLKINDELYLTLATAYELLIDISDDKENYIKEVKNNISKIKNKNLFFYNLTASYFYFLRYQSSNNTKDLDAGKKLLNSYSNLNLNLIKNKIKNV